MLKGIPDDESKAYFHPKLSALDESTIAIGIKAYFRNKAPMVAEFIPILNHAGQHLHWTVELGTTIEKIL